MERKALYPGSFDPITNGHLDIVVRALEIFDRIVIGVGVNIGKTPLFTVEERVAMIRESTAELENVEVVSYSGLTAKYAEQIGAVALIRGLRAVSDFEYEFQMTLANRQLFPRGETVFLMPSIANVYLNSSMVRDIASLGGNIGQFVPKPVADRLRDKFAEQQQ
ncbi:MAG TPA: pantetheine-phosphate adenylyltransferase [candidate division Zixibacteria bacterium]|nr:pantetheine-phosphate adenylyltransferase [candidate division Zixibacteria bacterium]